MKNITPKELQERWQKNFTLIDVRTPEEFALEHITWAVNMPLDYFQDHVAELKKLTNIVVYCNSWNSSAQFYKRAEQQGIHSIANLVWWLSWCTVCQKTKQKWALPMMQQVQIVAWSIVLIWIILSLLLHNYFIGLSAFVWVWLIFAWSTGWCWLAKLLWRLPWNRVWWSHKKTEIFGNSVRIKQFEDKNLAHYSYIAISNWEAVVVDPERDVQKYIDYALGHNARIIWVLNTHPHADFASWHVEIAQKTGATIYIWEKVWAEYVHTPLKGWEEISFWNAKVHTYFTPWHSPDSISYLIKDSQDKQIAFFTGDWLFLWDVGRADLRENVWNIKAKQAELAGMMYDTTREILPLLDGNLAILPAHWAGTSCGKRLSKMNIDTLANQRKYNPMLQVMTKEAFVNELTSDQPAIPAYFTNSVLLNKRGNTDYEVAVHSIKRITSLDWYERIVDTRPDWIAQLYPISPYSINIPHNSTSFVGMLWALIKPTEKAVLIIEKHSDVQHIVHGLVSIWYETCIIWIYVVEENMSYPHIIHKHDLHEGSNWYTVLDVRSEAAFRDNNTHENVVNIPIEQLPNRIEELDKNVTYIPYCWWTYKSYIAYSLLTTHGYQSKKLA